MEKEVLNNQSKNIKKLKNLAPYNTRFIRFVDVFNIDDWKVKLYWISWKNEQYNSDIVDFSLKVFKDRIDSINNSFANYEIAFGMIHEGKDGTYVILGYWIEENMLDNVVFMIKPNSEKGYERLLPDTIVTCVWELEVMYFEKKMWIEHMLKERGNVEGYLSKTINTDV